MKNVITNDLLKQAIMYLEKGWSVIPVNSNKKALIAWKKYQTVKPTKEVIKAWWTQYPTANIGIVTGKISGLIVVDLDPRHGATNEAFKNINTPYCKTGGGGWHYYFQYVEGLQNASGIEPGVDVRADGGYVIAPPSIHSSGKRYTWEVEPL